MGAKDGVGEAYDQIRDLTVGEEGKFGRESVQ